VKNFSYEDKHWSFAPAFFPICGIFYALVSLIPFALFFSAAFFLSSPKTGFETVLSAIAYTAVGAWFTRGFHLDGFCDACDAFSAMSASKEKRLEIMKDPRIGSSAAAALFILLTLKTACVFFLFLNCFSFEDYDFSAFFLCVFFVVLSGAFARFAMVLLAYLGKYPKKDGTAAKIVGKAAPSAFCFALSIILFLISSPFLFFPNGTYLTTISFSIFAAVILNVLYWKKKSDRMIGGVNGDILGACCESSEVIGLAVCSIALQL
jgi:adenosylcobinamide-GDP ribazoletransferase